MKEAGKKIDFFARYIEAPNNIRILLVRTLEEEEASSAVCYSYGLQNTNDRYSAKPTGQNIMQLEISYKVI